MDVHETFGTGHAWQKKQTKMFWGNSGTPYGCMIFAVSVCVLCTWVGGSCLLTSSQTNMRMDFHETCRIVRHGTLIKELLLSFAWGGSTVSRLATFFQVSWTRRGIGLHPQGFSCICFFFVLWRVSSSSTIRISFYLCLCQNTQSQLWFLSKFTFVIVIFSIVKSLWDNSGSRACCEWLSNSDVPHFLQGLWDIIN